MDLLYDNLDLCSYGKPLSFIIHPDVRLYCAVSCPCVEFELLFTAINLSILPEPWLLCIFHIIILC